jgi:hypothetical protein
VEKRTKENKVPGTKNEYSKNLNDVLNSENALAGTNWKVSREVDKNGNSELGGKYYIFHKKK